MKIVKFGDVIRKLRVLEKVTQCELVSMIDAATRGENKVDTVSISRWENDVITPSHKRQVEIVSSLGYDLSELIDADSIPVSQQDLAKELNSKIINNKYWDFTTTPCTRDDIEQSEVLAGDLIYYCFINKITRIPIAHVVFRLERDVIAKNKQYILIESLYCTNSWLLLDIIGYIMHLLIKRRVDGVIYRSKNSKTPISRFIKSIGFSILDKKEGKYIYILSQFDVLYNQVYFNLACLYKNCISYNGF